VALFPLVLPVTIVLVFILLLLVLASPAQLAPSKPVLAGSTPVASHSMLVLLALNTKWLHLPPLLIASVLQLPNA
jgi:hypothetical protein